MGGVDPEAEARQSGLLQFVALKMVDKSDLLMHLSLIDFFETLTLREILSVALRGDDELRAALKRLPDRTVEEEAEDLQAFIQSVVG
ncbi:hypothetical protein BN1723_003799 [Verticillium longisporum]|uniref:Uncharacterized protein n=1 Tax=Verticillium longisporum TaxID=100787 RepID=A0A0G4MCU3_VERLO|nr:hypothetical protein BN1723_003799 [Verticillium longisporum]